MKKTVLGLSLILAILLSYTTAFVGLTTANPAPLFPFPPNPIKTPPTIVVNSPAQNETYDSPNVWLNFSVIKPDAWYPTGAYDVFGNVTSVYYVVDGGERHITVHDIDSPFNNYPPRTLNFSANLTLTSGAHNITVSAEADSFYVNNGYTALNSYPVNADSEPITFIIFQNFTIPHDVTVAQNSFSTTLVITASVALVAVACAGLLVYFKKRKR